MPRALWKGAITFGLVYIPVELYPAEKSDTLDLTMLDRRDMKPVGYQRINKESGEVVPWEEIVKGYEYEKDQYVVLSDEDFRKANVEATQTVNIMSFVDADEIPVPHYETPYYLVPEKRGAKTYALLREALKRTGKVGIAHVVIRSRQRLAALLPMGPMLALDTLRYGYEIRDISEYKVPEGTPKALGVHEKELNMALRLMEEMTEKWDPDKYRDTYQEDILARVKEKIKAGETEVVTEPDETEEAPRSAEVIDLMALLKNSIDRKKRTGAEEGKEPKRAQRFRPRAVIKPDKTKAAKSRQAATRWSEKRKRA
jgi:DNA end-binding protein Ku